MADRAEPKGTLPEPVEGPEPRVYPERSRREGRGADVPSTSSGNVGRPAKHLEARFQHAADLQAVAALQDEAETSDTETPVLIASRYRVLATLGQGGMGTVYKAHDAQLDRTVAIKTILPQYLGGLQASRRFLREAQALARLNHPHILTLHDFGQDGRVHYLVMELGGRDLVRVLEARGGRLPPDEALRAGIAVARALEHAHRHGVVHRDLKPANILVGSADEPAESINETTPVKVMDFGLAKVQGASALTGPATQLGTPQYMAPEQVLGREADARSDLYALGILLYELAAGVRPFDGDDVQGVLQQHLTLEPVPPSVFNETLPPAFDALVLRLLEKDPSRRPAGATEIIAGLERLLGATHVAQPPPAVPPAVPPALPAELRRRAVPPGGTGGPPVSPTPSPVAPLPVRSIFVGRAEELAFLRGEYEAVAAGAGGRMVLVGGEPGAGKTRLVQELGLYARLRGGVFLEGHYLRGIGAPYDPWIDALRAGLHGLSRDETAEACGPYAADLAQILPELAVLLGPFEQEQRRPAPEEQRRRLFDGIAELVLRLAQRAPLVLLLDDLQWAPGLAVLSHVARRLKEGRVLVLGAYREGEFRENPALVREQDELLRARLYAPLTVRPFPPEQTAQMVANALSPELAERLAEEVHRTTQGNPFFVEEVLRSLVDQGALHLTETGWELAGTGRVQLPESLKLAVEGRVARLGDAGRETLVQAGVLGQEFGFEALRAMGGLGDDALLDVLDGAVAARLLMELPGAGERYAFVDDQVQEVLYGGLTAARRRRLHLRAGVALETLYPNPERQEDVVEDLARHFLESSDAEKGADYAYRAGRKADRLYVWSRSIPLYRAALERWERLGGHLEQRAGVCEQLGDACFKSGIDASQAVGFFEQSLALYEQLGDRRKQANLNSQIGREYITGGVALRDVRRGIEHLHRARVILEDGPPSVGLAIVYSTLANGSGLLLQLAAACQWAARAAEVGEALDRPALIADGRAVLGNYLALSGQLARGLTTLEQAWDLASRHNAGWQADWARYAGATRSLWLKYPRAGIAWAARRPDYRTVYSHSVEALLAAAHVLLGDLEAGTQALEGQTRSHVPQGLLALRKYEREQARQLLLDLRDRFAKSGALYSGVPVALFLGDLYIETGEHTLAEEQLLWALESSRPGGAVLYQLNILPILCELYVKTGRLEQAEAHLQEGQAILARPEDWCGLAGDVALAEGLVRAAQGRRPEADAAFERARQVYQQYELKWDEAKLYREWGAALERNTEQGNREHERARELLGQAADMWDAMGAGPWAETARERLRELG